MVGMLTHQTAGTDRDVVAWRVISNLLAHSLSLLHDSKLLVLNTTRPVRIYQLNGEHGNYGAYSEFRYTMGPVEVSVVLRSGKSQGNK